MNRKAVSPLVATVLLISFSVALGAVVMNWADSLSTYNTLCENADINVIGSACKTPDNIIQISIQNNEVPLEGIFFRIQGSKGVEEIVRPSKISAHGRDDFRVFFDGHLYGDFVSLEVFPVLTTGEQYCSGSGVQVRSLPMCS
ncbi:MAG: archaellin/type IV pilin N-terminal domain-containing protein [Candidatus Woesearchaeota archaeon]